MLRSIFPNFRIPCLLVLGALSGCGDPNYDAQYIVLPGGQKAYCNRQGYRELRIFNTGPTLVTDENGKLVGCDVRVGPEWDKDRVDEDGDLLTPEEMDQARRDRLERESNSPEAKQQEFVAKNIRGKNYYEIILNSEIKNWCPDIFRNRDQWFKNINEEQSKIFDWDNQLSKDRELCKNEIVRTQIGDNNKKYLDKAMDYKIKIIEQNLSQDKATCDIPFNKALLYHNAHQTLVSGQAMEEAGRNREQCVAEAQKVHNAQISAIANVD